MSMFIPIILLGILNTYFSLSYLITSKTKLPQILLFMGFLLLIALNLYSNTEFLYGQNNKGNYREAYKIINDNYKVGQDQVFGQYLRDYYLDSSKVGRKDTNSLGNDKSLSFEDFLALIGRHKSGFITWESRKVTHIDDQIAEYCCESLKQLAGHSCGKKLDNNLIEIFYFDNTN